MVYAYSDRPQEKPIFQIAAGRRSRAVQGRGRTLKGGSFLAAADVKMDFTSVVICGKELYFARLIPKNGG
jgi:hypothetical protein